jgi:hypothetical protein
MKARTMHRGTGKRHSVDRAIFPAGLALAFALSAAQLLFSPQANAQTCNAPIQLPLSPARPAVSMSTCDQGEPAGRHLCQNTVVTDSPSMVFNLTVVAGNTASLMAIGQNNMQPYFYLTGPACDAGACLQGDGYLSLSDVAPGDYSLVVTSSPNDLNCGVVSLMLDGNLVPTDGIFSGNFE